MQDCQIITVIEDEHAEQKFRMSLYSILLYLSLSYSIKNINITRDLLKFKSVAGREEAGSGRSDI